MKWAQHGAAVDIQQMPKQITNPGIRKQGCISDKQAARLLKIAVTNGYTEMQVVESVMRNYKVNDLLDLPWKQYETVVTQFSHPAAKAPVDIDFQDFIA